MNRDFVQAMQQNAFRLLREARVPLREEERADIEVADFGLGSFETEGACIATLVATERYSVKALTLLPGQSLPEHWHPPIGNDPGKLETVRGVWGECFLVTEGTGTFERVRIPDGKTAVYTCRWEIVIKPGDQLTLAPGQKHWFQGGPQGAVVYSFSSPVRDLEDGFTDPQIERKPAITD